MPVKKSNSATEKRTRAHTSSPAEFEVSRGASRINFLTRHAEIAPIVYSCGTCPKYFKRVLTLKPSRIIRYDASAGDGVSEKAKSIFHAVRHQDWQQALENFFKDLFFKFIRFREFLRFLLCRSSWFRTVGLMIVLPWFDILILVRFFSFDMR